MTQLSTQTLSNTQPDGGHGLRYPKILEIGSIPPPRGGWGTRIEFVLTALREQGIECAALDVGPNRKVPRTECDGARSAWDYGRKIVKYLARGYRIHNHLNGDSPKAYAMVFFNALLSRLIGRPAVLTWHGGQAQRFFPRRGNWLADLVNRSMFALASEVICNDEKVKRHITAYGVRPDKVSPIPAFSRQYLQYEEQILSSELERFLTRRGPVFFCYMCIRPEFHLSVLVQAMQHVVAKHPDFGLLMVGFTEGGEGFTQGSRALREEIHQAGLERNFHFTGDLDHDTFLTLLARADLFIRTPPRDGVCSSLLEALALGVPVVATKNPMRPAQAMTYETEDPADLARVVMDVMSLSASERRPLPPNIPDTVADEVNLLTGSSPAREASRS